MKKKRKKGIIDNKYLQDEKKKKSDRVKGREKVETDRQGITDSFIAIDQSSWRPNTQKQACQIVVAVAVAVAAAAAVAVVEQRVDKRELIMQNHLQNHLQSLESLQTLAVTREAIQRVEEVCNQEKRK
jgi:hypothetical protein